MKQNKVNDTNDKLIKKKLYELFQGCYRCDDYDIVDKKIESILSLISQERERLLGAVVEIVEQRRLAKNPTDEILKALSDIGGKGVIHK